MIRTLMLPALPVDIVLLGLTDQMSDQTFFELGTYTLNARATANLQYRTTARRNLK